MKIALLTHSVNPRGGVVHTLELAEAMRQRGHDVTVMAPARSGQSFFRPVAARVSLAALPGRADADTVSMVETRVDAYVQHLHALLDHESFDVLHAQDSISGLALAALKDSGRIAAYTRTVHHLDQFDNPQLSAWQTRAFARADQVFCVSDTWVAHLKEHYGVEAERVDNGVDLKRYSPDVDPHDRLVATRYDIRAGEPMFLAVGGVEARKNTLGILQAFALVRESLPHAKLVVAGGASLLDHDAYTARFQLQRRLLGLHRPSESATVLTGPVPDAFMPSLYRLADVLVMPSFKEGFGLAALEALACGASAVVSAIRPFTDYLSKDDCRFTDPEDPHAIAAAMLLAHRDGRSSPPEVTRRFCWTASADRHLSLYRAALPAVPSFPE